METFIIILGIGIFITVIVGASYATSETKKLEKLRLESTEYSEPFYSKEEINYNIIKISKNVNILKNIAIFFLIVFLIPYIIITIKLIKLSDYFNIINNNTKNNYGLNYNLNK